MTADEAKEKVREKYPDANIGKWFGAYVVLKDAKPHFIESPAIAHGVTEELAWISAAEKMSVANAHQEGT